MKKILAIIAAIVFLCCACEPSNEEKYITQLEERIAVLEQQLSAMQERAADTPLPQAATSLHEDKSTAQGLPSPQALKSADIQEAAEDPALSPEVTAGKRNITVFITKTGKKYHKKGCGALSKSCIPIALDEAISKGYTPCGKCNPP